MTGIHVDESALGRVRLVPSPLWEAVGSLLILSHAAETVWWPYGAWAQSLRSRFAQTERPKLVRWFAQRGPRPVPPFLLPVPRPPATTLDDELAAVRSAAPGWYADALADYWHTAIAPHWPVMRPALEEEVLARAQTLATEGADRMLADLRGRLRWEAPTLTVATPAGVPDTLRCRRLVLVPMLFGRGGSLVSAAADGTVAVAYQARGAAVLSHVHGPRAAEATPAGDGLALLVGPSRAALIRELAAPTTTTTLASVLGLALSTVSGHLATLVAAGIVDRRRSGMRVLYRLNAGGNALLASFDHLRDAVVSDISSRRETVVPEDRPA